MSFQACIDNIKAKAGNTAEDLRRLAEQKGLLLTGMKAGEIVGWDKKDLGLGLGHARAIHETLRPRLPGLR